MFESYVKTPAEQVNWADFVRDFCVAFNYPEEATASLVSDWKKIEACPEALLPVMEQIVKYEQLGVDYNFQDALAVSPAIAEKAGVHRYASDFLLALVQMRHLEALHIQAGLDPDVYYCSALDLRCKLLECKTVRGVWGTFVAGWYCGFYRMILLGMGRLEMEFPSSLNWDSFDRGPYPLKRGDLVVGMHIPSTGEPLTPEACMDSFRRAYKLFAPNFSSKWIPFKCSSWLLYEKHYEFLPPHSNILRFLDFFDLYDSHESPKFGDCWRIFGKEWQGSTEGFPDKTSLQRAYLDWIASGHQPGTGGGVFFFDGETIYNNK